MVHCQGMGAMCGAVCAAAVAACCLHGKQPTFGARQGDIRNRAETIKGVISPYFIIAYDHFYGCSTGCTVVYYPQPTT